ncbi:conserved membrane hypothetical protein [Burkholderia sp. 8Y]|uniref:DUF2127 domain-containing protein n=1 Tax=Burkholderia sp. 8Y TaxID=2653133 RepID=UPI0012F0D87A|nr:DUF2127 domain-containing protein [Burkholderia sp. 8Y]VXC92975.1 conserved membrane hypothetical protein [Burkholderia sp. 8Y]
MSKNLHLAFAVTLCAKAAFALPELIAGAATLFLSRQSLVAFVVWLTRDEFSDDPHDVIAGFLLRSAQHLSVGTQSFAAAYLLGLGLIKLWLIAGLLRSKLWYFPVALAVFFSFIAFQVYRFTITHSIWLLFLSAVDIVVIALTWFEYRTLRMRSLRSRRH